jgi:hypothetical protein
MTFQTTAPNLVRTTFGKNQMVLSYSLGYLSIPPGVYFETEFSVTFWAKKINQISSRPRLLDFKDVSKNNRILLTPYGSMGFYFEIESNGLVSITKSTTQLNLNEWTFVTVTYSNKVLKLYFNEKYVGGGNTGVSWPGTETNVNYFNKDSGTFFGGTCEIQIFDFKIYNKVISDEARLADFYNGTYNLQEMFAN